MDSSLHSNNLNPIIKADAVILPNDVAVLVICRKDLALLTGITIATAMFIIAMKL